jgi:hypothetical protein
VSLGQLGTPLIELPALHKSAMRSIDRLDKSFWSAVNHSDGSHASLGFMERQRVKVWLRNAYSELERVGL